MAKRKRADDNPADTYLWTEKYRPRKLEEVALEDDNRAILQTYLEAGEIPHILFVGPPGTGKTTVARIIYHSLDCRHMVLNASNERGIDTVRNKIGAFAQAKFGARWNIVFLDEFDATTSEAQTALRNMMEAFAELTRFMLTANKQHRIIGAIQDRCQLITMGTPPLKERYRILAAVLKKEKIKAEPQTVLSYAERYLSLRRMLMAAQRTFLAKGELLPAATEKSTNGQSMFEMLTADNYLGLVQLTKSGGFDPQQAMRELFWAVPDDHPRGGFLRHVLGRGVHETGFTPDPIILFLGTCSEAMEGLEK